MNYILKIGIFAATFMLLTLGVNAQTASPSLPNTQIPVTAYTEFTGVESTDTVTVGSRMPYFVAPQTAVTGLTFEYKWLFSPALTVQTLAGATLTGGNDYYAENEISVVMPATAGNITVTTNVRSMAGTTVLCTGNDLTENIAVVARPTINWNVSTPVYGCEAQDATVPLTAVTGKSKFEIEYKITYYSGYDNTGAGAPAGSKYLVLTGNTQIVFPATEFASGNGLYEIEITNITDRISRKSLDMNLVASQASDLPTAPFQVFIYPAPVTNPLQHVKNIQ